MEATQEKKSDRNAFKDAGVSIETDLEGNGNKRHIPSIEEVIAFCQQYKLQASQVGKWIWVQFAEDAKPSEALREAMKNFGFRWSNRRKAWAHNCGFKSRPAKASNPFEKYEVQPIAGVA
jgi:hypothetical protein